MNRYLLPFLFLLSLSCTETSQEGTLLVRNVQIVDVISGTIVPENKDVLINNDSISQISSANSLQVSSSTQIIDGSGKFLIPGLWDMHAHPDDPEIWRMQPRDSEKDSLLALFVVHGVTGIRDMAGSLELAKRWKKLISSGDLLGPEIYAGGPLIDGPNPMWDGSVGINNKAHVKPLVDSLITAGVDFLKVYSLLPPELYFELQQYANSIGFPVAGHVPYGVTPTEASEAGIKSQEHFLEITKEVSSMAEAIRDDKIDYGGRQSRLDLYLIKNNLLIDTYSEEKAKDLFELMAKNETWHTPTVSMWYKNAWFESEIKTDSALYKYLPSYMRLYWQIGENDHLRNRDGRILDLKKRQVELYKKMLISMHEAGVPLMTGTDMGANPLCFAGIGVHNELQIFVEAGISNAEALKTATINPARYLGIENRYGSVDKGKAADLVVLNANPLKDIEAVREINSVIRKGILYDQQEIKAILGEIEKTFR